MKTKWLFRFFIALAIFAIGNVGLFMLAKKVKNQDNALNHFLTKIYNSNSVKVICKNVDYQDIDIRLVSKIHDIEEQLYARGIEKRKVPNIAGMQFLTLTYQGNDEFSFKHTKKHWWEQHHYVFIIEETKKELSVSLQVFGPNTLYIKAYQKK